MGSNALAGAHDQVDDDVMKRMARALVCCAVVASVAIATPTSAQEESGKAVLLILDASGSMNRVDDNGVVLIEGAQQALTQLVGVLPDGAPVGLRVYGHRVPNDDKANGCQDTELIVPVGPLDRGAMTEAINSFGARGFTPIGLSLQETAADLPDGRGTVVLVSDGEDTCAPPDPCQVAQDLIASGVNIEVQTVGFFLGEDTAARAQLQCIATETGGSYREVGGVDTLAAELGSIVRNVLPGVGPLSLPILGSLEISGAPLLPMGLPFGDAGWQEYIASQGAFETVVAAGEIRWFAIEIEEGRGFDVMADVFPREIPAPGEVFEVLILNSSLEDARRPAPRRGPQIVDLHEYATNFRLEGFIVVAAGNHTDFHPYAEVVAGEPQELLKLDRQGYDEATYNAEALSRRLAPIEDPIEGGTYHIGLSWESDRLAAEINVGFGAFVTRQPADLYGQVYQQIHGGLGASAAAALARAADMEFDSYGLPPGDHPFYRAFYVSEINSGETRWYHQPVEGDEALAVEAILELNPDLQLLDVGAGVGAQLPAEGEFSVQIYDERMNPIGGEYHSTMQAAISDASPSPGVGASMAFSGEGDVPKSIDGAVYLAFTWTSPTEESAEVRFIADIVSRYPDGVNTPWPVQEPPPQPEPESPQAEAIGAAGEGGDDGPAEYVLLGALGVLLVGGATWAVRRRRQRA